MVSEEECPRVRKSHRVLAPLHNGFGNQVMGLEKAAWVAFALNRTLVVPPVLEHAGRFSFGTWPHCSGVAKYADLATAAYDRIVGDVSRPWTKLLDFAEVENAGLSVEDYDGDARSGGGKFKLQWRMSCTTTKHWGIERFREEDNDDAALIMVGSPLRMEVGRLRRELGATRCGWRLLQAAHVIPFSKVVRDFTKQIERRPYASVQLRTGDKAGVEAETVAAAVVARIAPQLPRGMPVFVAFDLPFSFDAFQKFLRSYCPECGLAFNRRDIKREHQAEFDVFQAALGGSQNIADIAIDQEFGSRASKLFLTDGATHTFRKKSSFGRILQRRWNMRALKTNNRDTNGSE